MSAERLAELEALLFASDTSLPLERIAEVMEVDLAEARETVDALREACAAPGRGLVVVDVAGGIRLVTRPELAPALVRLQRLRLRSRLSRAALETLAIVAYRQPISRPEIEQLRGVGAESVVAHLLERRLVRVVGRKASPGRPILYGTTREFLEHFGLRDLEDLPPFETPDLPVAPVEMVPDIGGEDVAPDAGGPPIADEQAAPVAAAPGEPGEDPRGAAS